MKVAATLPLLTPLATLALAACSGGDEHLPPVAVDARVADAAVDAPIDAPPGMSCVAGGVATVELTDGTAADPRELVAAWFNHGHVTKACFEIDVVLSPRAFIAGDYLSNPEVVEVMFHAAPVLGANPVQVHVHRPDVYLGGTVTLTTLDDTTVAGSLAASAAPYTASGAFTAVRCTNIFDPCL